MSEAAIDRPRSARDLLIETAARLFYRRGMPNVGINEVTDTAGVARQSLYNNFKSKEALAEAAALHQAEKRREALLAGIEAQGDSALAVLAIFDVAKDIFECDGFRGCAFVNLALESADPDGVLHGVAATHKTWIRETITERLAKSHVAGATTLGFQISALWDGAIVQAYILRKTDPITYAREAAASLIKLRLEE